MYIDSSHVAIGMDKPKSNSTSGMSVYNIDELRNDRNYKKIIGWMESGKLNESKVNEEGDDVELKFQDLNNEIQRLLKISLPAISYIEMIHANRETKIIYVNININKDAIISQEACFKLAKSDFFYGITKENKMLTIMFKLDTFDDMTIDF